MSERVLLAIGLTVLAGLSTGIGSAVAFWLSFPSGVSEPFGAAALGEIHAP